MINILCFGDSNTWGYNAANCDRFPLAVRWPGRLHALLGDGFRVIEEGQNGRTTVWDDPLEGPRNGHKYLIPCLETHSPVDIFVLMLGTNDLKNRFSPTAWEVAQGAAVLVRAALSHPREGQHRPPKVLLISPAPIREEVMRSKMGNVFGGLRSREVSLQFPGHFRQVAEENGCLFLDAAEVVDIDPLDGVHLSAEDHGKLAEAVKEVILGSVTIV